MCITSFGKNVDSSIPGKLFGSMTVILKEVRKRSESKLEGNDVVP
jgi:hypothetical protein